VAIPVEHHDEMGRLQQHLNDVSVVLRERAEGDRRRVQNLAERLGRVLDESSNEIYIFDAASWRFLLVNRGARANLGYTDEAIAELTPLDLLPEFDERRWAALLRTLQDGSQKRVLLSTVHLRADGSTYPVEMSLQLSHAEEPPVFHVVVQDVSERARIEAERDRVFDLSADLLATGTFDGRLTRVNPVWERTLGFKEDELIERPFFEFVHPDDRALARRQLEGLRHGSPIRGTAIRVLCRDGSYRWVSWNIDPPQEGVLYAAGRDITERRRAEQRQTELQAAVARAAREWTMTFDALDDPVIIVNKSNEIVRVNEAARRLTGLAHRDVAGKRLDTLAPAPLWRRGTELVRRATSTGRTASSQVRSKPDGRTWDIEVNPILGAGSGRGTAIVTAHDVTPVVRLQDSVRRNEAMAAMGSLVAGVAHEVRNPLFSMTATLDAFEARHGKDHPDQRHVHVLRSQLERLQQLMRELLEYGKPPQLHLEPVRFEAVVEQALEESAHLSSDTGVAVERAFENGLPTVRGDRARLAQVYVNLITNAIHHSAAGNGVRVDAHALRQNGTVWLETTVEDQGSGFNPDDLDRVFEPFFTRRRGGTGLGLALVHRIVEQHGGTVSAENRPEGGAAVRVRLPVSDS
jgi:PAS domain S-box-containing protein